MSRLRVAGDTNELLDDDDEMSMVSDDRCDEDENLSESVLP